MAYQSHAARLAAKMQKCLIDSIENEEEDGRTKAACVRAWLDLEWFKREQRGIPRLAATTLKEAADFARARRAPKEVSAPSFTEVESETSKESLSTQTVPTPPPQEHPLDGRYLYNKQPHDSNGVSGDLGMKSSEVVELGPVEPESTTSSTAV